MNWQKIFLKFQRNESFHSCYEARKIICWSEFPDIPKNWWSKRKITAKEETNNKKEKREEILNFKML